MTIRLEYQIIENNKFLGGRFLVVLHRHMMRKRVGLTEEEEYLKILEEEMKRLEGDLFSEVEILLDFHTKTHG